MNRIFLSLLALFLAVVAGCSSGPQVPLPEDPGDGWIRNPLEDTALFLATNDNLAKLIDIQNLTAFSSRDGGLKATCHLRDLTPDPLAIQIRANFRRSDGTTLEESPWQSVTLPPGKYIPFEVVNESGNAVRVLIEIKLKDSVGSSPAPAPSASTAPAPAAG